MTTRRKFLGCAAGTTLFPVPAISATTWHMPEESEPHRRIWMAFGHAEAIWGRTLLPTVQQKQIAIANTIAKFEPVTMLVREQDHARARQALNRRVQLFKRPIDDLCMHDTGPVFARGADGIHCTTQQEPA